MRGTDVMASCVICGRELSFVEHMAALATKRCKQCDSTLKQVQQSWFNSMEQAFINNGVPIDMEQAMYQHFQQVRMPQELGEPAVKRMRYLRSLSEIRWGNVPVIRTNIHLDSDEIAHFTMPATYYKPNKSLKATPGQLVGTNKKCYFLSNTGSSSVTLDWNNVSRVDQEQVRINQPPNRQGEVARSVSVNGVHITVSKGSGGGLYNVPDALYTKVIIDTLVRLWKRQIVLYKEQAAHGEIPQHVKNAVHLRDGGRCVQCGDSGKYLEYDHIIPRSKGGPNTVENVQLLCRSCNQRKGNRM